jgi:hypothetical protein
MSLSKAKDRLKQSLAHLECVIERKFSSLALENNQLKAEIAKLKNEIGQMSRAQPKEGVCVSELNPNLAPDASTRINANSPTLNLPDQKSLSDVQISLSKLKRLVS